MSQLIPYQNRSNLMLRKPVSYITLDESETIKRACDVVFERSSHTKNDEWIRDRDQLLLQLLWVSGARITDVLYMSTDQIIFKDRTIRFLVRKRKDKNSVNQEFWHTISIDMESLSEIMDYIQKWRIQGLLFKSYRTSNKSISRQWVNQKLKMLAKIAGLNKNVHCHLYRHGIAMHLQSQGVPAELIAYRLAHSSTQITLSTYARLDAMQEKRMLEALGARLR